MNNREIAEAILASDQYESGLVDAITQALDEKDYQADNAEDLLPIIDDLMSANNKLREALVKAEQFIDNGIEFGYIHLPDPEIGDTATDTPKVIREALAVLATSQGDTEGNILAGNESGPPRPSQQIIPDIDFAPCMMEGFGDV